MTAGEKDDAVGKKGVEAGEEGAAASGGNVTASKKMRLRTWPQIPNTPPWPRAIATRRSIQLFLHLG